MSKNPPKPQPKPRNVKIMRAIFDYSAEEEDELSFLAGDILYILDQSEDDWWKARWSLIQYENFEKKKYSQV